MAVNGSLHTLTSRPKDCGGKITSTSENKKAAVQALLIASQTGGLDTIGPLTPNTNLMPWSSRCLQLIKHVARDRAKTDDLRRVIGQ